MSDKGNTYYSADTTLVVAAITPTGETEEIEFSSGSVTTNNPAWLPVLEAYVRAGLLTTTPIKKAKE